MHDNNDSPVEFTWPRLFIAIGVVAVLLVVIQVGVTLNGTDHGPTKEQECTMQSTVVCSLDES
ncbi:hypothetical protein DEJ17_09700 [Curtobacterium sp. MCSS17_011]|uniref:hypothetical protein n=1 Tax=Curtobacterium sp. MCSS17_011 TaxID=2175643 RepID=UPI000D8555E1|nr:hypothetical protein [Curtobacterium sp. MCSS17_011]PYY57764.1 hypothetical protein DEJ17_09700 [Curtobacterium sp. MCSS17_011]